VATKPQPAPPDGRKLLEDFHRYKGIVFRGWKFILIGLFGSLAAAILFIASQDPVYKASSRLLLIQQGGHPVRMRGGLDGFEGGGLSKESLATHLLLLKSPVIVERAVAIAGVKSASVWSVIGSLTVKQPDSDAWIIDLSLKSGSPFDAERLLDGVIESYKLFLKSNYQKNSSEAISLITKARNELSAELKSLESAYLDYRQKNPAISADSAGHTFIQRRLDQWDAALNLISARTLQLQSQLDLGKKLSKEGTEPATIASALGQIGAIGAVGAGPPAGSPGGGKANLNFAGNDGSYVGIAAELADVESRRKQAELYLEHLRRQQHDPEAVRKVPQEEIERKFLDDPDVEPVVARLTAAKDLLAESRRVSRSGADPAILLHKKHADLLQKEYDHLWKVKKQQIAESLAAEANPNLGQGFRTAEADVVALKAREASLRERLEQVAGEDLEKLRRQHQKLQREHGDDHPLVVRVKERIDNISRQQNANDGAAGETASALLDSMTQSLESINAMRGDLQKKFDEDLALARKSEYTLLEESNLRNNLDRQRALFNTVVDQLKQARLTSDYDSITTQQIAPTGVAADQTKTIPVLFLAVFVGLGLGAGVAFLSDLVEARVRTLADVRKLVDMPLIGVIPHIRDDQLVAAGTTGLLSFHKPRSALAESYKTTRTNLESMRRSREARVLVVASSFPRDGKTTTACNLAITLANTGRRVLLVDGDLRKPSLHKLFDVPREPGFCDALVSSQSPESLIRPTFVSNLDLLTSGRDVPNPAELLASERLGQVLGEVRPNYDMVLIDSSPMLLVTDPSIIAAVTDGVILVVKIASIRRPDLDVVGEMLKTLGVPSFGMVINGVTREEIGFTYGYGPYGYGESDGSKRSRRSGPDVAIAEGGDGTLPQDLNPSLPANGTIEHV
jgi:capsular exopolysaccharide synthesis family protein